MITHDGVISFITLEEIVEKLNLLESMALQTEISDEKIGKEFWFEYHCWESTQSQDAVIWYRSHSKVKVLMIVEPGSGDSMVERIKDGCPRVYNVEFEDGFRYDVFEDELMNNPEEFYRPDCPHKTLK